MIREIKKIVSKRIIHFLEKRARRKLKQDKNLWSFLSTIDAKSTGCSMNDYWVLYSYILREKPVEVLELGSGISTVVMAHALQKNGSGNITSMEESEQYAALTIQMIPVNLRSCVTVIFSESIEKRKGLFVGKGYKSIPNRPYDFVFVDGPHYDRETSYGVDLLDIIARAEKPLSAIIDSRAGSCVVYNLFLKPKFYFDYFQNIGFVKKVTRKDLASYCDVIVRESASHVMKRTLLY